MTALNWIGRQAVLKYHQEVPFHLLHAIPELSVGAAEPRNLLIQGDNLTALKALLPRYAQRVQCIYIDPPYNTGNEGWIYNDNVNSPEIREWLGSVVGAEGEDLTRHEKWLCLMYPRLVLLRKFLKRSGTIFISIGDEEVGHLRCVMDEIFGPSNFLVDFIWQKMDSPSSNARNRPLSNYHDHTLVYARHKPSALLKQLFKPDIINAYPNEFPDGTRYRLRQMRKNGKSAKREDRPTMWYKVVAPDGSDVWPIHPDEGWEGRWTISEAEYYRKLPDDEVRWVQRGERWVPYTVERAPSDPRVPQPSILTDVGQNRQAKAQLNELLGTDHGFETPKPIGLVQRIVEMATERDSLVLDAFAGSGTTGHAVWAQNAKDDGTRQFILVETLETVYRTITQPRLIAALDGIAAPEEKTKLFEGTLNITKLSNPEALKDLLENADEVLEAARNQFDKVARVFEDNSIRVYGYRVLTPKEADKSLQCAVIGEPLFNERRRINERVTFHELAAHVFFTETGVAMPRRRGRNSALLGVHGTKAVYLLYNGVLRDRDPNGGNILTPSVLAELPPYAGPKVIYAAGVRGISRSRLERDEITFKQTPYEIKVR